ncbi:unnamed protein product [Penicillium olsonii]|nr:unnamed protein product [Penicillium olsonii]
MGNFREKTKDYFRHLYPHAQKARSKTGGDTGEAKKSNHVSSPDLTILDVSPEKHQEKRPTALSATGDSSKKAQGHPKDQKDTKDNEHTTSPAVSAVSTNPQPVVDQAADQTFQNFRESDDQKLLADWAVVLASFLKDDESTIDLSSRESVAAVMEKLLKKRDDREWKIKVFGQDVKLREQVDNLAALLFWADPLVKSAVSSQPYAALAWSGVSLFTSLLRSGLTQHNEMLEGFTAIGQLQMYWQICEDKYLEPEIGRHYKSLIEPLARLYSMMMEYQVKMLCHLSRISMSRAVHDVKNAGDWSTHLTEINQQDAICREHFLPIGELSKLWEDEKSRLDIMRQTFDVQKATLRHLEDERESKLLVDLYNAAGDYEHFKKMNPKRTPGTCEWFLTDNRFLDWYDRTSDLLWVSAGPGCGKSVLARSLVEDGFLDHYSITVTPSSVLTNAKPTVAYFFFKEGGNESMNGAGALCAILHQLFRSPLTAKSIDLALSKHREMGPGLTQSFSQLWRILIQCAAAPETGEIICVLDALDECEVKSRREILQCLQEFYTSDREQRMSKLKFIISSRPYQDLEDRFQKLRGTAAYMRLDGDEKSEEISHEIDLVIDEQIEEITVGFDPEHRNQLVDHLKGMKNRTYLWLRLIFDVIQNNSTEYQKASDIENLFKNLPMEVSDAYEKILNRSQNKERTRIILQLVLAARRPLTLDKANYALTSALRQPKTHADLTKDLWPKEKFKTTITSACGLFVSVHKGKLSFIHQTAREFLTDTSQRGGNAEWKGSFTLPLSDVIMSKTCIQYLLLPDIGVLQAHESQFRPDLKMAYPFISYSAAHWIEHFRDHDASDITDELLKNAGDLCRIPGPLEQIWRPFAPLSARFCESDIELAVKFGLVQLFQLLISDGTDRDLNDNEFLLHEAAERGHLEIVKMLIDHGADAHKLDPDDHTALCFACSEGHQEIVQIFLDEGVSPNPQGKYGLSALWHATRRGSVEICAMLLDHGAEIDWQDSLGDTALHHLIEKQHLGAAELLIEKGASVNIVNCQNCTALHLACEKAPPHTVEMLLLRGADPFVGEEDYSSLELACKRGDEKIVKLLIENFTDSDIQKDFYWCALQQAAEMGHLSVIQMLFQKSADANLLDHFFAATLPSACIGGNEQIVEFLLKNGVDVDAREKDCDSTLELACRYGHQNIVAILLREGADLGSHEGKSEPLRLARSYGHQEIVKMLLSKDATVYTQYSKH